MRAACSTIPFIPDYPLLLMVRSLRRTAAAIPALVVACSVLAPAAPGRADPCLADAHGASFVGAVYDAQRRQDFQLDVDHFEAFLQTLRATYCIPAERAGILAFDDGYTRNDIVYPSASESAVVARLGELAHAHPPGEILFFMLSSHGNFYADAQSCGAPAVGSFAALGEDADSDGDLHDCELGGALAEFAEGTPMVIVIDCSFCGGFSDSLTAASGTVPDDVATHESGVPAEGRIVITGCAVTTECFGSATGGVLFTHMRSSIDEGTSACDGYTAPLFPLVQGINLPQRSLERDGMCTVSEWFFASIQSAYARRDPLDIQQQFRIKYGMSSIGDDIRIL
jgi:hypothetical protein